MTHNLFVAERGCAKRITTAWLRPWFVRSAPEKRPNAFFFVAYQLFSREILQKWSEHRTVLRADPIRVQFVEWTKCTVLNKHLNLGFFYCLLVWLIERVPHNSNNLKLVVLTYWAHPFKKKNITCLENVRHFMKLQNGNKLKMHPKLEYLPLNMHWKWHLPHYTTFPILFVQYSVLWYSIFFFFLFCLGQSYRKLLSWYSFMTPQPICGSCFFVYFLHFRQYLLPIIY